MSLIEAVLLGLVQGLTEFLPVSSSGHLVLGKAILGVEEKGIAFEIFVHFGTLLAVLTVYRNDLLQMAKECLSFIFGRWQSTPAVESAQKTPNGVRLFAFILLGTIPAALLGFLFKDTFESVFSDTVFVSGALIFTGILLTSTNWASGKQLPLTGVKAFLIGLAQVIALFPGVSRSGTTITVALLFGIKPEDAAKYSFLLAIPLILAVTLLQSVELFSEPPTGAQLAQYSVGCVVAYFSGLWAIKWLIAVVQNGRFARFAWYCFALGFLGLAMHFVG